MEGKYHKQNYIYISVQIKVDPEVSWIKLNVNQKGYYRVNYEPAMWDQLADLCAEQVSMD